MGAQQWMLDVCLLLFLVSVIKTYFIVGRTKKPGGLADQPASPPSNSFMAPEEDSTAKVSVSAELTNYC